MAIDQHPIRVIQFLQDSSVGIAPDVIEDLNGYFPQQGIESSTIILSDDGLFRHTKEGEEVTVCRRDKKSGFDLKLVFKLARYFKLKKIQAVHIHDVRLIQIVVLASRLAGVKSYITLHGLMRQKVQKFWFDLNTSVIFNSNYVRQDFFKTIKMSQGKYSVIRDGFNIAGFQKVEYKTPLDELKKQAGINQDHFILGNMGGLLANQDQVSLLKAFRKLAKKALNVVLVIVGDGPMKSELEKTVKEFDLEGRVRFVPESKDAEQWMKLFHIFILSANVENYSRYVLKALACAKPVIATKIGSQAELINDEFGFLVPCGFPERIESAVMRLYASQELLKKMGSKGREHLTEKLSMDRMAVDYASLYRSCLK